MTGGTNSSLYPSTPGALNNGAPTYLASQVFLSKFSPSGTLLYSAFLGDPDAMVSEVVASSSALALDSAGNAYVAGEAGPLWPTTAGAYLRQNSGAQPFVAKVAADGGSFVYSTLLDFASAVTGVAVLPSGNVFVAGTQAPSTYPTTPNAYQPASTSSINSYLTELNATGSAVVYSTFFGDATYYLNALALDPDGDLWVTGETQSPQFPLVTPLQSLYPLGILSSPAASTLSQFDPTGTTLKFSTFLGGIAFSTATGLAVDSNHRAHVAGSAEYGLYTTSGVYLETVSMPDPSFQGNMFPYVALVDTSVAAPALCLKSSYALINWGQVTVGTFLDEPLTITNCGTLPLSISSISAATALFTVPAAENGCTQPIAVGQSCTVSVRYSPLTAETDNSTLTLVSNASITQAVLNLNGVGVVPKIQVSGLPPFDYTLVGQTSAPVQLLIGNAGGAPLTLNAANTRISGDFSLQGLSACSGPILGSQGCLLSIYFTPTAPGSRTGTLQIASNDPANPTVSVSLQGTAYTGARAPEITSLGSQLLPAGVGQTDFPVQGFGFLPSSVVEVNGIPQKTTYVSDTSLTATLAAGSIPANSYGELAVTVDTPTPGGGQSAPFILTEYQSIATQSSFLLYEPVGKQLYASIPAASTTIPNTVLPINPVTAAAGMPIAVGNDPGVLAASSDGAYLYVALNGDHTIQRINLSTLAIERTFDLPVDPESGNLQVADMHVVPGNSTEVAVSLEAPHVSPAANGVAFFNDAGLVNWIGRTGSNPNVNSISSDIYRFAFTNPGTVWGISAFQGTFNELTVSPAGIATTTTTCCGASNNLASDGTLIYSDFGLIWNPATGQQVSQYAYVVGLEEALDSVISDASSGKTYFLNAFSLLTVLAFDQASSAQTSSLTLSSFGETTLPSGTELVRWGSNGFAMRGLAQPNTASGAILLFTSSITGGSNLNAAPVASTLAPVSTPAGGANFTLTVNGSGFLPGSAVEWNGSPRLTTMVSPTQLTATIYASDIAAMGTGQVMVANPGNGAGVSSALSFTISAALPPPAPIVTISPSSLTFATQEVSTASAAQMISLKNSGNADLSGVKIVITGTDAASFAETDNCGATVGAGTTCSVDVVFTPAGPGNLSATVNITDNAANSPQTVALTGTGTQTAFAIASQPGGSATITVSAGQPATYALSLTPAAGYSGSITLSCSGLPADADCSFTPATLALAAGKAQNFSLSIATEAPQTGLLRTLVTSLAGVLLLLPMPWRKRRKQVGCPVLIALLLLTAGLSGCGGGGSGTGTGNPSPATVTPGTYTIQVVASDGTTTQKMPLTLVVM